MNDERARHLFEALGLKPEDLPEPVPPTEEEVRQRVGELLVKEKAEAAADALAEWPEQALPALRDAFTDATFLDTVSHTAELHRPLSSVVDMLCKSDPQFVVEHIEHLLRLPETLAENCLEVAFEHGAANLAALFERLVANRQESPVLAALLGIRRAVSKQGLTVDRSDLLYQCCLRVCSPEYAVASPRDSIPRSDPAVFVCQAFGSLAMIDLAVRPYFDIDNPHFEEILQWLPAVVSHATAELVRTEFQRAVESHNRDSQTGHLCERFLPLAALKLGDECRPALEALLARDGSPLSKGMRSALTQALAIVSCGRDPLEDALAADYEGKFDSLNAYEQAVMLVYAFDAQVRNGHVFQFLFNSPGIRAAGTCEALKTIGDTLGLELLQAGIDAVMSEVEASSPHEAARRMSSRQRRQLEPPLDELFTRYCAQDDVTQRIYAFVLENPQHFKR